MAPGSEKTLLPPPVSLSCVAAAVSLITVLCSSLLISEPHHGGWLHVGGVSSPRLGPFAFAGLWLPELLRALRHPSGRASCAEGRRGCWHKLSEAHYGRLRAVMGQTAREDKTIHNCYTVYAEAEATPGTAPITFAASSLSATCSKTAEHTGNKPPDTLLPSVPQSPATEAGRDLGALRGSYAEPPGCRGVTIVDWHTESHQSMSAPCYYVIAMGQKRC